MAAAVKAFTNSIIVVLTFARVDYCSLFSAQSHLQYHTTLLIGEMLQAPKEVLKFAAM